MRVPGRAGCWLLVERLVSGGGSFCSIVRPHPNVGSLAPARSALAGLRLRRILFLLSQAEKTPMEKEQSLGGLPSADALGAEDRRSQQGGGSK